jgi:subtilase family serine protease
MCLYFKLSDILFENCEKMNDGIYIKCMELLKQDYDNKYSYILAQFLLKNKEKIDSDVLTIMFTIILQDLDRIQKKMDNNKKIQENENKKNYYNDLIMFITLFLIHIRFIYIIFAIFCYGVNNQIPT